MLRNDVLINPEKRELKRVTTYDAAVVYTEAEYIRKYGNNGFSKGRNQRVIGEIPVAEFFEMKRLAEERGEEFAGTELKNWLRKNPEYMTVNGISTNRNGNGQIIIK